MTIFNGGASCFYYPTRVMFLDDNRAFLDALELELSAHIRMLTFTDTKDVLHALDNSHQPITSLSFKPLNNVNTDTSTDCLVGFKMSNLLNFIYDGSRFNYTPVIVVDYQMPNINGIEFCQQLKSKDIFKIMLTAEADKDTAIKAFNDGIIDKFILKTSENLFQELLGAVDELTARHFREMSYPIINAYNGAPNLLNEELFKQLFNTVYLKANAVEYYMLDISGSFLFLDKSGNPTWLVVRHAIELKEQLDFLQGYDAPEEIISSIAKKEKMLILLAEEEYLKPIAEWFTYIFDSKKLDDNYCYSIIEGRLTDSVRWNEIVPYDSL